MRTVSTNALQGKAKTALQRLERMVEDRLRANAARADDLAAKLTRLEQEHEALKNRAVGLTAKLEDAIERISTHKEAGKAGSGAASPTPPRRV
jgi:hypothetical protein